MGFLRKRKSEGKHGPTGNKRTIVANVSDDDLDQLLHETNRPVVVDFWAPWCAPCKLLKPAIENLAQSYESRASVVKINVDENTRWTGKLGIRGIPTIAFFMNGEIVTQLVGLRREKELRKTLEQLIARTSDQTP
jgi:thioredoxin 1